MRKLHNVAGQIHRLGMCFVPMIACLLACKGDGAQDNTGVPQVPGTEKLRSMVWIDGGVFTMGTDDQNAYQHERPAHRVRVEGFWMDKTEVTNGQFQAFVEATGYTTVAERAPDWEELRKQLPVGTEKPSEAMLVPGSLVFHPVRKRVDLRDISQWWQWTPGADWRHPEGPGSHIDGLGNNPVVHIAHEDALAFCTWVGKRLPTEAEWEFAGRGGREGQLYPWGDELRPGDVYMANTYQGLFPVENSKDDGYEGVAPVRSFAPNDFGLYDMIGNVWEWTSDLYHVDYYAQLAGNNISINPQGPESAFDPSEPYTVKYVTKGGSYLCANDYCVNYRCSARQARAYDSGASNIGFRCVRSEK